MMRPWELEELSRRTREAFPPSCEDSAAIRVIRQQPDVVLDCLSDLMPAGKRILSFKVLRRQLTVRQISRAIIRRPDTMIVFIRRRPIDAYISLLKAHRLRRWKGVDTTDLKVDLDADAFLKWRAAVDAWYHQLETKCWSRNKAFHRLSYEEDVDCAPAEAARRFCAILARRGIADLEIPSDDRVSGLTRQDGNRDVADRVANWAAFRDRLTAMESLGKAFAPFAHFRPSAWEWLRHRVLRAGRPRHPAASLAQQP